MEDKTEGEYLKSRKNLTVNYHKTRMLCRGSFSFMLFLIMCLIMLLSGNSPVL